MQIIVAITGEMAIIHPKVGFVGLRLFTDKWE
jgi:hypothetical protein